MDEELTYGSLAASELQTGHSHSYCLACTWQVSCPRRGTSVNGCLLGHQGIAYFVILESGYRDAYISSMCPIDPYDVHYFRYTPLTKIRETIQDNQYF